MVVGEGHQRRNELDVVGRLEGGRQVECWWVRRGAVKTASAKRMKQGGCCGGGVDTGRWERVWQ